MSWIASFATSGGKGSISRVGCLKRTVSVVQFRTGSLWVRQRKRQRKRKGKRVKLSIENLLFGVRSFIIDVILLFKSEWLNEYLLHSYTGSIAQKDGFKIEENKQWKGYWWKLSLVERS
jgi:hypothetical protein